MQPVVTGQAEHESHEVTHESSPTTHQGIFDVDSSFDSCDACFSDLVPQRICTPENLVHPKRNVFRAFGTVSPNRIFNASGVHLLTSDVAGHDHLTSQWSEGGWTVFIDEERQLFDAIRYVERRAMKEVLPRQSWDFVRLNVG